MSSDALILVRISQFSILIPLILVLIRFRYRQPKQALLSLVVVFSFITEIIAFSVVEFGEGSNNLPIYHIHVVILFYLFNRIYQYVLGETIKSYLFDLLLIFFILFAFINSIWIQPLNTFNSNTIVAGSVIYILFSLLHFRQLLQLPTLRILTEDWTFWLSTGLLLYHSSALMLFFFVNYIEASSSAAVTASWLLNALFNVILNGFYSISLWKKSMV